MGWWDVVKAAIKAAGAVVDKVVPGPVGGRTAILVTACQVAPIAASFFPMAAPAVPVVHALCAWLAPATAAAGVARRL